MPRYFSNVHDIGLDDRDDAGEELPNDEAARREATVVAAEIFRDKDGKMRPDQD
jgi:hypothetical protein